MDILAFSEQLQNQLKEHLCNTGIDQDDVGKIGETLAVIRETLAELKAFTINYQFNSEEEEITFFRQVKPVMTSQYYYFKRILAIRLFDSFADVESRKTNYVKSLGRLQRFVRKNLSFYEYIITNATHHDKQYFTRIRHNHKCINKDEKFTTGYDVKLSKLLANELLKKHILQLLHKSQNRPPENNSSGLSWTGSKTDLIELIYALHSVEVFNNGTGNLKQIASTFESFLNVSLGDYYRTFQDMRIRKKSQTPFLDQLRDKFIHRINESANN